MRILFIWPAVDNTELRNLLPLGFGYLAANLPKGHRVRLWDGVLKRRRDNNGIVEEVKRFQPDLIGLSIWNFNLKAACEVANLIKKHFPEIVIVVGGPSVSGYRDRIFTTINADYAFTGEGEKPFRHFLELFANHVMTVENLKQIDGLIYKDGNEGIVFNPPRWESLDDLKYCDYRLLKLCQYLEIGYRYGVHHTAKRTAPILTTRGCPFPCEYCSARQINGRRVRTRPVESVIAEVKELHQNFQIDGFNIIDDNFTYDIDYAKQVCRSIVALGMQNVSFCCPNGVKVEYLDQELLHLMKQAGWECLFIAPESGSERTLKNMRKQINLRVVEEKLRIIKQAGLRVFGFFMIGYPNETAADIKMTIDFACRNDFDLVVFTCFQPLVGTPVYEKLLKAGEIDKPPEGLDYYEISYAPKGLTVTQMKFWRFWGLTRFYTSSPKRLKEALSAYSVRRVLTFVRKII
jgi:radical SAM superfamily enzyme YgiQ (UPF0313 family)